MIADSALSPAVGLQQEGQAARGAAAGGHWAGGWEGLEAGVMGSMRV